jgi:DNA-binding protein HU-beta
MQMNSSDLADHVAEGHGLTKADAKKIVDSVFAAIVSAAAKNDEVSIPGFGKFKVKDSPARDGRNPATGAAMKIAASRKLAFTVAKAVKDKLNG